MWLPYSWLSSMCPNCLHLGGMVWLQCDCFHTLVPNAACLRDCHRQLGVASDMERHSSEAPRHQRCHSPVSPQRCWSGAWCAQSTCQIYMPRPLCNHHPTAALLSRLPSMFLFLLLQCFNYGALSLSRHKLKGFGMCCNSAI